MKSVPYLCHCMLVLPLSCKKYLEKGIFLFSGSGDIWPYHLPKLIAMHQIFSDAIFSAADVTCSKCHWNGSGSDIQREDLFLTDAIELYCPRCDGYMGFVSSQDEQE